MFVKDSDKERCKLIVKKEIELYDLKILENFIDAISEEIINISYSKGGDYKDSTLSAIASVYFENEMYKKYL